MSAVAISWCGLAIFHSHDDAIRPAKPSRSLPHAALRGFFLLSRLPHHPRQPLQRRIEGSVAFREAEADHGFHRAVRVERADRDRGDARSSTRRRQKAASSGSPKAEMSMLRK